MSMKIKIFLLTILFVGGCATGGRATLKDLQSIPDHQLMLCQELGTRQVCALVDNNRHLERELLAFKRGYRDYG